MPTEIIPSPRAAQRDGGHGLRVRAVVYEDARARVQEAQYARRSGRPQTHILVPAPALLDGRPLLQRHVAQFGTLPSVTRSSSKIAPRIERAHTMHRHGGVLAFLRFTLPELDGLPLRAASTVARARELVTEHLEIYAPGAVAYDVAFQRGAHDGTHVHVLTLVVALAAAVRRKARRAPAGKGGGVALGSGVHVVRVADSAEDRAAVAAYMGREPDARLDSDDPSAPAYLDALEELLQHRSSGEETQLTWGKLPRAWRS